MPHFQELEQHALGGALLRRARLVPSAPGQHCAIRLIDIPYSVCHA